ncbi:type VI secretion system Vgr family protein [Radicibacter daui]|uniref:type VI secretion system Vgr family protein n=1 Tax=Radicibacter daui TaxID=3064829 RepID=UPI004046FA83
MTDLSQDAQYFSLTTPLGKDKLILREFSGEESLSGLFHYKLTMDSTDANLAFDSVVGKDATITIGVGLKATSRYITGVITRFELSHYDEDEGLATYEADLRAWFWLLQLSGDNRIYQQKTVPEIVEAVCSDAGYAFIKKSLSGTYTAREYCVQYGESDFNFICRLLEEEGIFYFFSHTSSKCEMVLGDGSSAFTDAATVNKFTYRPTHAFDNEDDAVTALRYVNAVTTKTMGLDSFNFETPSTDLYTKADGTKGIGGRHAYTGRYTKSADGEKYAKILMQAAAVPGELVRGTGHLRSLTAGAKFNIASHPRTSMNGDFIAWRLRIKANRAAYTVNFEAFPSSKTFNPPLTAERPRIHSSQTAIVVGKSGEEIWADKYGRIKVQFHWDRLGKSDDSSSCWIRVSQGWAGKSFGAIFLPRIGQEVIVSFLEGDPDQPIVTGAVYNAEQTVPYALPDNSTRSTIKTQTSKNGTGKFNEIRFEDKADSEEVYIHAQKDMKVEVVNDLTETIDHDHSTTVKNDHKLTVSEGNETYKVEKGTRDVSVKGKETHKNEDNFEHTVSKDYKLTIDGNLTIEVTGDVSLKGKSLSFESSSAGVKIKASTTLDEESGTAYTIKSGTTLGVKSGTDAKVEAGMGLTLKAAMALQAEGLSATVKGSTTVEVNGSAMTTIKGGMVKIN